MSRRSAEQFECHHDGEGRNYRRAAEPSPVRRLIVAGCGTGDGYPTGSSARLFCINADDVEHIPESTFLNSSVTSSRHFRPGSRPPRRPRICSPAEMVASRQAACRSGNSSPSESMFERAWWTLKKYLGMQINAGAKIMFQGTGTLRWFTSCP
jgi:hypothetical protein